MVSLGVGAKFKDSLIPPSPLDHRQAAWLDQARKCGTQRLPRTQQQCISILHPINPNLLLLFLIQKRVWTRICIMNYFHLFPLISTSYLRFSIYNSWQASLIRELGPVIIKGVDCSGPCHPLYTSSPLPLLKLLYKLYNYVSFKIVNSPDNLPLLFWLNMNFWNKLEGDEICTEMMQCIVNTITSYQCHQTGDIQAFIAYSYIFTPHNYCSSLKELHQVITHAKQ